MIYRMVCSLLLSLRDDIQKVSHLSENIPNDVKPWLSEKTNKEGGKHLTCILKQFN